MRSTTSIELYNYWSRLRGDRPAPRRQEVEPGEIRRILPDLFILERVAEGDIRIRLAGTNICNLYGRELRGSRFEGLWSEQASATLVQLATDAMVNCCPAVITATAYTNTDESEPMEMSLLPLVSAGPVPDRLIGALTPALHSRWMHTGTIAELAFKRLTPIDSTSQDGIVQRVKAEKAPLAVSAVRPASFGSKIRQVLHLRVFEGGRAD